MFGGRTTPPRRSRLGSGPLISSRRPASTIGLPPAEAYSVGRAVVVRDFVAGSLGVISRSAGSDLVVEYTPAGLLALNRGTTGAESLVVAESGEIRHQPSAERLLPHLGEIATLTKAMADICGDVTLEWVLDRDTLRFVDCSVLGADQVVTSATGVVVSPGSASGPVLTLDDTAVLARLSVGPAVSIDRSRAVAAHHELARLIERVQSQPEPPIVRVDRPYAVLSVLIGSVAGFVFDHASALCHLAILLREHGVPAVGADDAPPVADGTFGVIGGGLFTVVGPA